ncbi:unnamed protein product [Adineta steineri]|uniref:Uncharacterized protein n=1 Tax=Adineta steineri TaxID=433720 RepID=A0A815Z2E1_9BILA|nr:unnamed protein product [Adineta steineri]CAF1307094.1 unnamed protein product [Adineta steineri]CAF1578052.1 unnamed protein product [Adineta steineri]CAF1578173.1 unnamed protein product [Adineta steineri]
MYLSWIDYAVFVLLLIFSGGIGIYQGSIKSKHTSTKEFLVADGRMKILPTAMSLMASITSAASLLGVPVEIYYYGTMLVYSTTYITMKVFIPKFHQIGSVSIYAYLEQRFSLTIRILVTCTFILITILYMSVILYGPSLTLSQVTGLNIWIAIGACGLVCTIYTKYMDELCNECDPLRAKLISRPDQLYPLFVVETLGRIPGLTGLFISCILSTTLSTFSSGVNSMATVILEDIYKRLSKQSSMSDKHQVIFSKILSVIIGCLTVVLAFFVSYMENNMITIILQIFGTFAAPILGVYLLGLFSSRVKSRSAVVAFFLCLIFQIFMLVGYILTVRPANKHGG